MGVPLAFRVRQGCIARLVRGSKRVRAALDQRPDRVQLSETGGPPQGLRVEPLVRGGGGGSGATPDAKRWRRP